MKPLAEVTSHAIAILSRELGLVGTIRFRNQLTSGSGNDTLERDALFPGVMLDQIVSEIEPARKSQTEDRNPS